MNRESMVIIEKLFWSVNEQVQLFKDLWAQPSTDKKCMSVYTVCGWSIV